MIEKDAFIVKKGVVPEKSQEEDRHCSPLDPRGSKGKQNVLRQYLEFEPPVN